MVFSVHLQRSAVVAIVNCQDHGQFIGFRSLKPVAPQWIWLFQEALSMEIAIFRRSLIASIVGLI
jgi:hypothetical protein